MIVRLRFKAGPPKRTPVTPMPLRTEQPPPPAPPPAARSGLAAALTPAAVLCLAFAAWRIAADLGMAYEFVFTEGLLSRWQLWLTAAVALQGAAYALNHRGAAHPQPPPPAGQHPRRGA